LEKNPSYVSSFYFHYPIPHLQAPLSLTQKHTHYELLILKLEILFLKLNKYLARFPGYVFLDKN
jgi:hypothetical protein